MESLQRAPKLRFDKHKTPPASPSRSQNSLITLLPSSLNLPRSPKGKFGGISYFQSGTVFKETDHELFDVERDGKWERQIGPQMQWLGHDQMVSLIQEALSNEFLFKFTNDMGKSLGSIVKFMRKYGGTLQKV